MCGLPQGLTPTEVVEGYELALKKALELLPTLVCGEVKDMKDEEQVKRAIKPSVMSKQFGNEDFITDLITKACCKLETRLLLAVQPAWLAFEGAFSVRCSYRAEVFADGSICDVSR